MTQYLTEQIQLYFAIIQRYFGIGVAAFVALQPLLILITSAAHAVEVQGRNRGWAKIQACGYWIAKVCGTFAAVDMRNVQRVGGKVFVILTDVIAAWAAKEDTKDAVTKAMNDAGRLLILALAFGAITSQAGCVGTLDDARGRISPAMGAPRSADLSKRCQSLSDREFYLGFASTAFGATGLGAVVTSIPVDEPKWETVAVISGASAAAVSVVTGWGAIKSAATYVEEGCAK